MATLDSLPVDAAEFRSHTLASQVEATPTVKNDARIQFQGGAGQQGMYASRTSDTASGRIRRIARVVHSCTSRSGPSNTIRSSTHQSL
ncbi:hypothetical protein PtA15_7A332 [Puccinia triticina]|uniref:Uncharacterized protein n=2 Tax=Puccinia triticina TaxID=208348 RepID=A0ABY7CR77_9BASI|nr:uncharacterized protein PtA15_7A332 [Puccinia triticina]WAQ86606.1 hypothetical protein PtA15_7A332 [Puccinia triticina]WAR56469.1 hypothetical protein PtB15_7B318 [Puccinia triticina]